MRQIDDMVAYPRNVVEAMLSALNIKDMETVIDIINHGGYDGGPFALRDLLGCGCCSGGPTAWYESWDRERPIPLSGRLREKSTYRYLSDKDYKLRINPDFEEAT